MAFVAPWPVYSKPHLTRHCEVRRRPEGSRRVRRPALFRCSASDKLPTAQDESALCQKILLAASTGDVAALSRTARVLRTPVHEIVDERGATPMHLAAEVCSPDAVATVFEIGRGVGGAVMHYGHNHPGARATVATVDNAGSTALHYAALCTRPGSGQVARKLLLFGADALAKDSRGHTAREVAQGTGNREVAELLRMWEEGERA